MAILAYEAEQTIEWVLDRIPQETWEQVAEVCLFDDASKDATHQRALAYKQAKAAGNPLVRDKLTLVKNPVNLGYGGNQKVAYRYGIHRGHSHAVLLHGDGQYAPEVMSSLLEPALAGRAHAVLGSRMWSRSSAIEGGMPLYKYAGNRVLTTFANLLLGQAMSEYHTGYRVYDLRAMAALPFERNTDDFHFDTQILLQFLAAGYRIEEVPIPTHYGDEVCHVDGLAYARNVVRSVLEYKLHSIGLSHHPEYDLPGPRRARLESYELHERIASMLPEGSHVLEVGCGEGALTALLTRRGCRVDCIDPRPGALARDNADSVWTGEPTDAARLAEGRRYDWVLAPDSIEHLADPQAFLTGLRSLLRPGGTLLAGTGNVSHWFMRLSLLAGRFSYTPRGLLDRTHLRLFTPETFTRLLADAGFEVFHLDAAALPVEEILPGLDRLGLDDILRKLSYNLGRLAPGPFAYQVIALARPVPDPLDAVLAQVAKQPGRH